MTAVGELGALYSLWSTARAGRLRCALATVVSVQGSSYRFPGARMLVVEDGRWAGTVSGGCLEADVVQHGLQVLASAKPICVLYDTTADADIVLGLGMGCRGRIHILVEPLAADGGPLGFLAACTAQRSAGVLGSVFSVASGVVELSLGQHCYLGATPHAAAELNPALRREAELTWREQRSRIVIDAGPDGATMVLWEYLKPAPSLLICGAGHDALSLLGVAKTLSWQVDVLDARPAYLTEARFPSADRLHLWRNYPAAPEWTWPAGDSAALVMTHNFERDGYLLPWLLASPARYIGLLGPKARTAQLLAGLQAEGYSWTERELQRLYAPVGLDLGGESPAEIALAIIAEVQMVLSGYGGGSLRDRSGPIHRDRPALVAALTAAPLAAAAGAGKTS